MVGTKDKNKYGNQITLSSFRRLAEQPERRNPVNLCARFARDVIDLDSAVARRVSTPRSHRNDGILFFVQGLILTGRIVK